MLELDSLQLRNFMSYGDYWTTIPLADMGQCLIVGEVVDGERIVDATGWVDDEVDRANEHNDMLRNSNGAGKSALPNGLLWCLFGRTMYSSQPGNKVINWFTKGDCVAKLNFKSGDSITRIRTAEGHTELVLIRGGNKQVFTADTLATTQLLQTKLNQEFQLDWDIFCGSVCFSQYGRTWLEMQDNQRKQALERMLRVDRYSLYYQVAKEKADRIGVETESRRLRINDLQRMQRSLAEQLIELQQEETNFETNRAARRQQQLDAAQTARAQRDAVELPEMNKLREKWLLVKQIEDRLQTISREIERGQRHVEATKNDMASQQRIVQDCNRRIELWRAKSGKICVECEQEIRATHVEKVKVAPKLTEQSIAQAKWAELEKQQTTRLTKVREQIGYRDQFAEKLERVRPKLTIEQAELRQKSWEYYDKIARQALERAEQVAAETNPMRSSIYKHEARQVEVTVELGKLQAEIDQYNVLYQHYSYIGNSYKDRRKIKSYVFSEYIPFMNSRLAHYTDVFNLDINLEFTDSLAITSDRWGYDFFCGGERKRADVALMLAVFDLYEFMYGRQCNVMILDEVDSRLDMSGVDSLVQIIKNDLASKVETMFIISHRSTLLDLFPRHINVKRAERQSYVEEIR